MKKKTLKDCKILALIPARGGSVGLKNKNLKKLANKPLIFWPINSAKKSKYIDSVVVSTDSKKIKRKAMKFGAKVPFLRPKRLAKSTSKSFDSILHCLNYFKKNKTFFDYIVLLEPTSPLTTHEDIDRALKILHTHKSNSTSIVGVSKNTNNHPSFLTKIKKNGNIKPYLKNVEAIRRQSLSPLYFFDGSLYISKVDTILKKKTFYHDKTLPYITEKYKSFEVDDMIDYVCIEAILKNKKKIING
jgi:CMP-N,N'-diacetyllegionaminic acid synthase